MTKTYAVLYNNVIENIISSDLPVDDIELLPSRNLVEIPSDHELGAGYRYDGEKFIEPINPNYSAQDPIDLLKIVVESLTENQRNSLLQILSGQSFSSNETPLPQTTL